MPLVIFDLDNTLADTDFLKPLRDRKRWSEVMKQIDRIEAFAGVSEMWTALENRGVEIAVVTHSPSMYASPVLRRIGFSPAKGRFAAYHDLKRRLKPDPYGYSLVADGHDSTRTLVVGDARNDLEAATRFGAHGAVAGWARANDLCEQDCVTTGWRWLKDPRQVVELAVGL